MLAGARSRGGAEGRGGARFAPAGAKLLRDKIKSIGDTAGAICNVADTFSLVFQELSRGDFPIYKYILSWGLWSPQVLEEQMMREKMIEVADRLRQMGLSNRSRARSAQNERDEMTFTVRGDVLIEVAAAILTVLDGFDDQEIVQVRLPQADPDDMAELVRECRFLADHERLIISSGEQAHLVCGDCGLSHRFVARVLDGNDVELTFDRHDDLTVEFRDDDSHHFPMCTTEQVTRDDDPPWPAGVWVTYASHVEDAIPEDILGEIQGYDEARGLYSVMWGSGGQVWVPAAALRAVSTGQS